MQGSSKDGEWERVSSNRYIESCKNLGDRDAGFWAFSCLCPAAEIPTTERPYGAKLAVAGFLHHVKHHEDEVSNALTMVVKRHNMVPVICSSIS